MFNVVKAWVFFSLRYTGNANGVVIPKVINTNRVVYYEQRCYSESYKRRCYSESTANDVTIVY